MIAVIIVIALIEMIQIHIAMHNHTALFTHLFVQTAIVMVLNLARVNVIGFEGAFQLFLFPQTRRSLQLQSLKGDDIEKVERLHQIVSTKSYYVFD